MHEKPLARHEPAAHKYVRPDGEKRLWQTRRLFERHALWHGERMGGWGGDIFGISPTGQQSADLIANGPLADRCANRDDLARPFEAGQIRGIGGGPIKTGALQSIRAVHPGIGEFDHDLIGARHGHRTRADVQHIGAAGLRNFDGAHHICLGHSGDP